MKISNRWKSLRFVVTMSTFLAIGFVHFAGPAFAEAPAASDAETTEAKPIRPSSRKFDWGMRSMAASPAVAPWVGCADRLRRFLAIPTDRRPPSRGEYDLTPSPFQACLCGTEKNLTAAAPFRDRHVHRRRGLRHRGAGAPPARRRGGCTRRAEPENAQRPSRALPGRRG